ncbi:Zinc/iron permease [Laetiporus sulphureus 93-53]|uniref:Zinc/iron permease n=1 Tax=Laetiporus sulphureus 93-53 TaxID=1314785 RepID=A0A165C4E4_9APHY|nr:Zinc/iron permease [Laetiporus sulphureus 93-53]KZT02185.1 Zinc/iron permease [Laetiporus sulphureus 93-53]
MSGLFAVVLMSALLGAASFGIGVLPLFFNFSKHALAKLSAFGTGLLLGAALGVIIPEGAETLAHADSSSGFPTSAVALSLLTGFTFMLVVEQLLSPHSHDSPSPHLPPSPIHTPKPSTADTVVEFDVELGELERAEGIPVGDARAPNSDNAPPYRRPEAQDAESRKRAYPLTLGLVMHALADGLALGSSALSAPGSDPNAPASALPSSLSLVVFFALVIHKAPTALALTTSLLSTSLPRSECKKHLALFSASTPLGALASYVLLSFFGTSSEGRWPGVALLISGGTFLYVATVLRPVSGHGDAEDVGRKTRVLCIVLGMFVPFAIGVIVGHDHERGA